MRELGDTAPDLRVQLISSTLFGITSDDYHMLNLKLLQILHSQWFDEAPD